MENKEAHIDMGFLKNRYYHYWKSRLTIMKREPADNYSSINCAHIRKNPFFLKEERGKIYLNVQDVPIITGIERQIEQSQEKFLLYSQIVNSLFDIEEARESIIQKIEKINKTEKKEFYEIFYEPQIKRLKIEDSTSLENFFLSSKDNLAIEISAQIKEIPRGKNEGISTNLFDFFRRFCIAPLFDLTIKKRVNKFP